MGIADPLLSMREQRILGAFLLHPERDYSVSELVRISGGHGATQNVIDRLRAGDVIRDERVGNQRRYRINTSFPLYPELRSICLKSFGLGDRLKEALAPLASRIMEAFVYGSVAKGTDRSDSDIDLFIVGDVSLFDVAPIAEAVSQEIGRRVHAQIYEPEELASLSDDKVLRSILSGPRIEVIPNAAAL